MVQFNSFSVLGPVFMDAAYLFQSTLLKTEYSKWSRLNKSPHKTNMKFYMKGIKRAYRYLYVSVETW